MLDGALRLSKSKINEYHNVCSWKFKLRYIDGIPEPRTPFSHYADEGTDFHNGVVHFFSRLNPFKNKISMDEVKMVMCAKDHLVENFINYFVHPILLKGSKGNPKYYFPVLTEEKIYDVIHNCTGIVDAIFINPKDDEYIVLDWKTGKSHSDNDIREEMAFYKFIVDESKKLDKPIKYWAMFFVKEGKLFFEEADDNVVKRVKDRIPMTQNEILQGKFTKNPKSCHFCGYNRKFGGYCDEGKTF